MLIFEFISINVRCNIVWNTWYFLWRCIAATELRLLRNITNVPWHFYALGSNARPDGSTNLGDGDTYNSLKEILYIQKSIAFELNRVRSFFYFYTPNTSY